MNDVNVPKVIVRREIAAPAQELFDAWLDPASLAVWMRPGGAWHHGNRAHAREAAQCGDGKGA